MKGEVSITGLLACMVSTRSKNQRWPVNADFVVLGTVKSNPRTVYNECNKLTLTYFESTLARKRICDTFCSTMVPESIGLPGKLV